MDKAKQNLSAVSLVLTIVGISVLGAVLVYGGAGWGSLLLCIFMIVFFEYIFVFKGKSLFSPYTLMLLSPLLLLNYSSITDFNIRILGFVFLIYIFNAAVSKSKREFKFSLQDARPVTIWLTAFAIFALTSCLLYVQGIHLSGDEPHYIMISQSLVEDGDFDLKNNFEEKTYYSFLPIDLRFHGGEYNGKYLSFHLPGVSFLLLPFYWLFKLLGGLIPPALFFRLAASVINAFFALCLFYLLKMTFPDKKITGFWLFMLCVFPLVFHGNHLYPELPAATLMMAAYLFTFRERKSYLLAGLFLALVPWFHVKYIPPLLVLAGAILYRLLGPFKPFQVDSGKIHRLFRFFIFPLLSLVLLIVYSKLLYGSFSPTDIFPKESYWGTPWLLRLKVFLAYFLDQRDGLLFYTPLLFLFFFSFKKKWTGKYLLLGIGFVYVFFHAFTTVRGAYAPAGRPLMFVSWILILFSGHFYFNIVEEKEDGGQRFAFRALAGLNLFVLAWLFYYPLFVYQPVFAGTVERASGFNLFLGSDFVRLWEFFPSFLTHPETGHAANFAWPGLLVLLLCFYYIKPLNIIKKPLLTSGQPARAAAALLALGLAFIYCFYPHVHLIAKNKHTDRVISFYNNSRNFRFLPDKNGFRIKAGNRYDIFIDRKMVQQDEVTFQFTHTDVNRVTVRNGKRLLFESRGEKTASFTVRLSSLSRLKVMNRIVSHIGFDTDSSGKNSYLWLEIK
jgi:hypothetical protein